MIDSGVKVTWRWSFVMRGWGHQVNDSGIGQLQGDSQLLWPVRTISTNNNWQRKKHVAWKITFYRGEILFHIEFSCKFIKIYFFVKVGWVHTEHNEGVLGGFKRKKLTRKWTIIFSSWNLNDELDTIIIWNYTSVSQLFPLTGDLSRLFDWAGSKISRLEWRGDVKALD